MKVKKKEVKTTENVFMFSFVQRIKYGMIYVSILLCFSLFIRPRKYTKHIVCLFVFSFGVLLKNELIHRCVYKQNLLNKSHIPMRFSYQEKKTKNKRKRNKKNEQTKMEFFCFRYEKCYRSFNFLEFVAVFAFVQISFNVFP